MSNAQGATIASLTNLATGAISGGAGGLVFDPYFPSGGGAGVANAGTIGSLTNGGTIEGGGASGGFNTSAPGGAGVSNAGTIATLTNRGAIRGGNGGGEEFVAGAGVSNSGTITALSNAGTIRGGAGGSNTFGMGGAGGAGISNSGTIGALSNSGTIRGGAGGSGPTPGAAGDAITSAGANASIGPITNSGQIIGNVEIDNQANVTITGGTGTTYGQWTGGTITVGDGNLTFAGGNTALGDSIIVDGGTGMVTNNDPLRVTAPITITGNFDQSVSGELDFALASALAGQYGALTVSGTTSLDGGLGLDLTNGFRLSSGDMFDLLTSGGALTGGFDGLSLNGAACSATSADVWRCGGFDFSLDVIAGAGGYVDLGVTAVPEPGTWALLSMGFLCLAGLSTRCRMKQAPPKRLVQAGP